MRSVAELCEALRLIHPDIVGIFYDLEDRRMALLIDVGDDHVVMGEAEFEFDSQTSQLLEELARVDWPGPHAS